MFFLFELAGSCDKVRIEMAKKGKILIVWHSEEMAVQIGNRLKNEQIETDLSGSYPEALMLLSTTRYDVVLTEHYPPRIDSYKLLNHIKDNDLEIPAIVIVPLDEEEIAAFFKKGAFDVIRKSPDMSFTDKVPFCVKKALEEKRCRQEKREIENRITHEKAISEAIMQNVINSLVFINNQGMVEKVNMTFEMLMGKGVIHPGENICELPEDHVIKQIFLKPLESGVCWEIMGCDKQECPAYGRRDCLCWFIKSACASCGNTAIKSDRLGALLQCKVYKEAHKKYYSEPMELEYNSRFFSVYRRNVIDEKGVLIGELLDFIDMTSERNYREQLRILSITDGLTGLHNRRYVTERVAEEFYESKRYNRDMSVMILDIDDFKQVNDAYGHHAGDEVLKQFAAILEGERRKSDVVGRYGGEEFVIVMPHTGRQEAAVLAERLRKTLETYKFSILPHLYALTVSIGISSITEDLQDVDDLLKIADKALYAAKTQGKNRVVVL
ncbi:MAG: GGDEF domain-containing response regulator [Nitrospirae bacterium]|nr:GGDEF domain-containing response regulator [Nitrospirota bacterium]